MPVPVPMTVPPQEPVYQYHFAPVPNDPPFLLIEVVNPAHIVPGDVVNESDDTEFVFNVIMVLLHAVVLQAPCART